MSEWFPYAPVSDGMYSYGYRYRYKSSESGLWIETDCRVTAEEHRRNGCDVEMREWTQKEWAASMKLLSEKEQDTKGKRFKYVSDLQKQITELLEEKLRRDRNIHRDRQSYCQLVYKDELALVRTLQNEGFYSLVNYENDDMNLVYCMLDRAHDDKLDSPSFYVLSVVIDQARSRKFTKKERKVIEKLGFIKDPEDCETYRLDLRELVS
jgi:hypothetical protein